MPREFMVDFTELDDVSFEPVPVGVYVVHLQLQGDEKTNHGQDKGTPYIRLKFVVDAPEEYAGRVIYQNLMLAGKGVRLTAELLRACGYEVQKGAAGRLPLYDINGRPVAAKVAQRVYNDTIYNEIKNFMQLESEGSAA
jgi:hypothetical protein